MNSEEIFLKIRIFDKENSFAFKSTNIITLKEIKEKAIKYFKINSLYKDLMKFLVRNNGKDNDDKIYISSEDDIIKYSTEKDSKYLIIELQLTFDNDKGLKTILMDKDKDKNNKSLIDNNIRNENICNECEGNMMKINELNKKIKLYKEYYLNLLNEIQILNNELEDYKGKINKLKEENLKLTKKIDNLNNDFELVKKKKDEYIKELEKKVKVYDIKFENRNKIKIKLIKEEKVIDINIQSGQVNPNFNEQKLNSIKNTTPIPMEKEFSPIPQNNGDSNYNSKNFLNPMNFIDKGILGQEQNLNDNLNNINIEEYITNKNTLISRNEEIRKENDILNFNPKTEIKRMRSKKKYNIEEKKLDIDTINKIRKQCGDQIKDYSDEKIQKILDENGGNYMGTITDIMLRTSRIIRK